jgi:hypothetical protein
MVSFAASALLSCAANPVFRSNPHCNLYLHIHRTPLSKSPRSYLSISNTTHHSIEFLTTTQQPKSASEMPSTFDPFSSLPLEIRLIIWDIAFTPRVISLLYDQLHWRCNPNGSYDADSIRPELPNDARFSIAEDDLPLISALSVCLKSQNFAKKKGYRTWKLRNISDETKQVRGNPNFDVVCCGESWQPLVSVYTPSIELSRQFPLETTLIRYLALPSSQWWGIPEVDNVSFVDFKNVREICTVVDIPMEYTWAVGFKKNRVDTNQAPFILPDAVKDDFLKEKNQWLDLGRSVPIFRAVTSVKDILSGETRKFMLRCRLCMDMHDILLTDAAKELIEAAPDNTTLMGFAGMNRYPPEWFLS